jgi:hypothetical protein
MGSRSRRPTIGRQFTLLDAMILVGAMALGLAANRWFDPNYYWSTVIREFASNFTWDWGSFEEFLDAIWRFSTPHAVSATLAVLTMRLRNPRPRWRRLSRQPGLTACVALLIGWAAGSAYTVVKVLSIDRAHTIVYTNGTTYAQQPESWEYTFAVWGSILGGFAVVVAWATLLLVGRLRAEPSWLDRLGRLAGLAWIAMALLVCFLKRTE